MAVSPSSAEYGRARLRIRDATSALVSEFEVDESGTTGTNSTFPNAHKDPASSFNLTKQKVTTNATYDPFIGVAIVTDKSDPAGDYTGSASVTWVSIGALSGITSGTTFSASLSALGTYRLVVTMGNNASTSQNINNAGGANSTYHFDSDGNQSVGTTAVPTNIVTKLDGWLGTKAKVNVLTTSVATTQVYPNQPTLTVTLTDSAGTSIGSVNPKTLKVAVRKNSGGTVRKLARVTVSTGASSATSSAYNVDTQFESTLTAYDLVAGINDVLGDSTTDSTEKPDLATLTVNGLNTSQLGWVYLTGAGTGITQETANGNSNSVFAKTSNINVGSGISAYTTSIGGTTGVATFDDSGHTTARSVFRRKGPTTTLHAVPFLHTVLANANSTALNTVSIKADVLRAGTATAEPSQNTANTTSSGVYDWNYTVANTHTAFNRAKGDGAGGITDNPASPPATFSGVPCYAKDVKFTGNAFSGTNEPTLTVSNVFGLNSEPKAQDIFPALAANATANSSTGEPTGTSSSTFVLGSGSCKYKISSAVNASTNKIAVSGNPAVVDLLGGDWVVTTDPLKQKKFSWNVTLAAVDTSPTNSTADISTSIDYTPGSTSDKGFDTQGAPTDASSIHIGQLFADTTGQMATTFLIGNPGNINSGAGWSYTTAPNGNVGFTGDTGNYGYVIETVTFSALDTAIICVLGTNHATAYTGQTRRIVATFGRFNNDWTFTSVTPDAGTVLYYQFNINPTGTDTLLNPSGTAMTAISGSTSDFEANVTIGGELGSKIIVTASVNSSRVVGTGRVQFSPPYA